MSITKILTAEKTTAEEKIAAVAEIVASAREAYGNTDVEIPCEKVNTAHGAMSFTHLEDEAKVALLRSEAASIKARAVTYVENNPGSVINKKVEELLATNPFFANVSQGTKFDYL